MSGRSKARKLQKESGIAYQTCLMLVRGEFSWIPQSPNCVIARVLNDLSDGKHEPGPNPEGRLCMCEECDP